VNCQETQTLLPEYQEGVLQGAKLQEAETHLTGCASCRGVLAEAKNLDVFLREGVRVPEPPADFWSKQEARVLQAAGRRTTGKPSGHRGFSLWIVGVAALVIIAVGVYVVMRPTSAPVTPMDTANAPEQPKESGPMKEPVAGKQDAGNAAPTSPSELHPSLLTFPTEPRSQDPAPEPYRPVPPSATAILPGDPEYLDRLTAESIEVGLAETPSDRVIGLFKAADDRLSELKAALGAQKGSVAEDLAAAYTMILRQGITAALDDRQEDPQDLDTARTMAKIRAGGNARTLAALEPKAQGTLKDALRDALQATREIANR
jgi:hypothetical protein